MASGGIAHALVRRSGVPVLLVKPEGQPRSAGPELVPEEVLVPLDGSAPAERVLEPAMDLALVSEARCTLLRVVGPEGSADEQAAEAYLERVARGVRREGLDVTTRVVRARDAAAAIVAEAGRRAGVLVAMTTHGRCGLGRLVLGSVAERVLRGTASPVLLYHPAGGTA
jgi:nucleotide-binding universal stress UspA family protein